MRRYLCLILLSVIFFSCHKSNNSPSTGPTGNGTDTTGTRPGDTSAAKGWKLLGSIPSHPAINDICFTSPSKGFAAVTDGYLYQTSDSGWTWTKIPNSFSGSSGMSNLFFVNSTYGFAQSVTQLQVTTDGGNTWSLRNLSSNMAFNIFFTSPSTGYYGDINAGVYKTTDTGKTWTKTFQSTKTGVDYPMYFLNPDKGFIFCGDATFSKTNNGGDSWQQIQQNIFVTGSAPIGYNTLQFLDSLTGYYASNRGLLKTTDGGSTWNSAYPTGNGVNVVKFVNTATGYFLTGVNIFKSTNAGQAWKLDAYADGGIFVGMSFIDSTGWACTSAGNVFRTYHP